MLAELAVADLGVIEHARLVLGESMTALTGETGAGKTLIVQAVHLLTGGRADASMVRTGAEEARVEGRFLLDGVGGLPAAGTGADTAADTAAGTAAQATEIVLTRVVSANGRSRAYVDGAMATITRLSELGAGLVDLHGQHQHQSLLAARTQRDAVDRYGGIDLEPLRAARAERVRLVAELGELGGDAHERAREAEILRFQVNEIDDAAIVAHDELDTLAEREDLLADATAHIAAGHAARELLADDPAGTDDAALDKLARALAELSDRTPFAAVAARLRSAHAELDDAAAELRRLVDAVDDDPEQLEATQARRRLLLDLTRKYGDTLTETAAFGANARDRLTQLEQHAELAEGLERAIAEADSLIADEAATVAAARRAAAPLLAAEVTAHLASLAMPHAELTVEVGGDDPADAVEMRFAANSGVAANPLAKVASGGELARVMLALRLVLTAGPPTLVFDEVDAGIGGEAAVTVGRSLARLGAGHQVLVVTHLPQVAACARRHVRIAKTDDGTAVVTDLSELDHDGRIAELTRMLAGRPDSASGAVHAAELLDAAAADAARPAAAEPRPAKPRRREPAKT
ncbi:MAG TPA: DNA repair protein RecN [Acidimicrobiaceae bacterium]|nr:DNA repair protein RecN [Acidimicrobiaceae bacterium]